MNNEETHSGRGMLITSMLVGLGTGIAATILFATYSERRFRRVTQKTRTLGDRTGDYIHGVEDHMLGKADHMVDSARNGAKRLSKNARDTVNSATKSADASLDKLAESAHRTIDSHMHEPGHG